MQIFKFGGASVKDAESVKNVSAILKRFSKRPTVVVVSAMGKITNLLEKLTDSYFYKKGDTAELLEQEKSFHLEIASSLFEDKQHRIFEDLNNIFVELQWALEDEPAFAYDQHYDQIV